MEEKNESNLFIKKLNNIPENFLKNKKRILKSDLNTKGIIGNKTNK